jgi:hypothetical protein
MMENGRHAGGGAVERTLKKMVNMRFLLAIQGVGLPATGMSMTGKVNFRSLHAKSSLS